MHDMNHSLAMPIAFADYLENRSSCESLRDNALRISRSLNTARSMLDGFMTVHVHDESQVAGMMTGMLDDIGPILGESLDFAKKCLHRKDMSSAAEKMTEMAIRNIHKTQGLLRQLVDASPAPRAKRPVNVPEILQSVIDMAASKTQASGIEDRFSFRFSVDGTLPSVDGDARALERVFSNLLINAVHAMPDGGKVRARAKLHGEAVLVTISDSGIGMDDETVSKIFRPFFTTKGEKGTGLGMAIVNEVVKAHGGQVTVRSQLGEGTTFQIALPSQTIA